VATWQRIFVNLLSIFLLAGVVVLIFSTWLMPVSISILGNLYPDLPLGGLLAMVGVAVGLAVLLKGWEYLATIRHEARRIERNRERAEVTAEASSDKVKALEAKVETLEKALSKALEEVARSSSSPR
jgi:hypothetical protein